MRHGWIVHNARMAWQTRAISAEYDVLAPDGSEIRLLSSVAGASMVHCTLPAGQVTRAVRHRTVEELWYCIAGRGELWRHAAHGEEVVELRPGVSVSVPLGTTFQFRAPGPAPLALVITTIPPWPGPHEAIAAVGRWTPTNGVGAGA